MDAVEDALEAAREGFAVQSDAELLGLEVEHLRLTIKRVRELGATRGGEAVDVMLPMSEVLRALDGQVA